MTKNLITTCYKNQERDLFCQHDCERTIWLEYIGDCNGNYVPDPEEIELSQMEADHITLWRDGERTIAENCQILCKECNRRKGAK